MLPLISMVPATTSQPFQPETVTMKPPTPTATYCEPSYGTGTGLGSGSARAPEAAGLASPFVSAHSARSRPDSAMARACAFAIWLLAMKGSVEVKARTATVSAVISAMMISVIGTTMPASDPCRRAGEAFIGSSGDDEGQRVDAADHPRGDGRR